MSISSLTPPPKRIVSTCLEQADKISKETKNGKIGAIIIPKQLRPQVPSEDVLLIPTEQYSFLDSSETIIKLESLDERLMILYAEASKQAIINKWKELRR